MKFAGFAFLAAALTVVFHAYEPGSVDPSDLLPDATPASPVAEDPPVAAASTRNFALGLQPTLKSIEERAAIRNARGSDKAVPVAVAMLPSATALGSSATARREPAPLKTLAVHDGAGRSALVRRIKRELRRVGCYYGRIDGDWDSNVRGAADTFMDRVNASLPNSPDHVLLALVRNHKAGACDGSCPRGQSMSRNGRCMPDAIVAKMTRGSGSGNARKPDVAEPVTTTIAEVQTTAARVSAPATTERAHGAKRPPLPGRMAMGAPGSAASTGTWWDGFMTPSGQPEPRKEQTLDRPVGLTHVPRVPRAASERHARSAALAEDAEALSGPALQPAAISSRPAEKAAAPRRAKRARAYRPRAAKRRPSYARRWSGRNVQMMFQHPLGRM